MEEMMITGLTGGMGSGKSSAARFLCHEFSVSCYSADRVAHELLEPGHCCWRIARDLNPAFVNADRSLDKALFRQALFADAGLRREVNSRMHPLVRQALLDKMTREWRGGGQCRFLLEVPLLYEAGWLEMFSAIVVVYASREKCIERVARRDRVSRQQAEQAILCQEPLLDKALRADHVVDNSGLWTDTCLQLLRLGEVLWGEDGRRSGA